MLWILIGYMFLYIHRPFEIWPILGDIHLERVYMLAMLALAAIWPGKRWLPNWMHLAIIGFGLAVFVCWMTSPFGPAGELVVNNFFKMLVFYFLIVVLVNREQDLKTLVLGFLVVMAIYMTHSLREFAGGRHVYRMGIMRLTGVDDSLGDPNAFGNSIVYSLPLLLPFWVTRPSPTLRAFLVGYVVLAVACIGLTGSRSSFVGLLAWVLLSIPGSRARGRWLILALFAAPLLWIALPSDLQNRFETIIHPEVGPEVAQGSAEGRIRGLMTGGTLWEAYPATGCGPGAWIPASGSDIESHNLYGQVIGEMGTLGALALLAILVGFFVNVRAIRKAYAGVPPERRDFLYHLARAVGIAVLLLLFEGNFSHNLYRHNWLWFGGFLIIARYCVEQRLRSRMAPAAVGYRTTMPLAVGS
jgi:hypothetical protein